MGVKLEGGRNVQLVRHSWHKGASAQRLHMCSMSVSRLHRLAPQNLLEWHTALKGKSSDKAARLNANACDGRISVWIQHLVTVHGWIFIWPPHLFEKRVRHVLVEQVQLALGIPGGSILHIFYFTCNVQLTHKPKI